MSDLETLKAEIKKLSAKATQAKMDLHDLSEELLRLRAVESCRHAILRNPRSIAVPPEGGPDRPGLSPSAP